MRQIVLFTLVLLIGCAQITPPTAPEDHSESVAPGINDAFTSKNTDVEQWATRFTGESREVYNARFEVVDTLGLKPGDVVADIGAGTGLYIQLFANTVGAKGKVFAVEISEKFIKFIDENAAADGLTNIQTVLGSDRSTNLPANSIDLIFHSDTYHHFEYPTAMNRDLFQALKPNGQMIVLDFERIPGVSSERTLRHVRAGKETVIKEIEASGFSLVEEIELPTLKDNYLLRFNKTGAN